MRSPLVGVVLLVALGSCRKEKAPSPTAPAAPATCTMSFLRVADPDRCETSCFAGDAQACDVASAQFHRGILTRRDPGRALSLGAKGCDLGASESCAVVASILTGANDGLWPDGGVYADEEQRKVYLRNASAAADKECTAGAYRSCHRFAYALSHPALGEPDTERAKAVAARAVTLMDKACAQGDGFACDTRALDFDVGGLDVPRDTAKALEFFGKACAAGYADACGHAYSVKASDDVRGPFLKRGCELGQGDLCFLWSLQLEGEQKTKALERGCVQRDGLSCHALANAAKGEEAKRLLSRACAVGHENACEK